MRVLSPTQCREIVEAFDAAEHKNDESGLAFYSNSVGLTNLAATLEHAQRLTTQLSPRYPGLVFSNSYTRQYRRGSVLRPHTDRPGLDLTLSVCLEKDSPVAWPLNVSRRRWPHGEWRQDVDLSPYLADFDRFDMAEGVGALCEGRKFPHWRDEFLCEEGERAVFVFYHWTLPQTQRLTPSLSLQRPHVEVFEDLLSPEECERLIRQAIEKGRSPDPHDPWIREIGLRLIEQTGLSPAVGRGPGQGQGQGQLQDMALVAPLQVIGRSATTHGRSAHPGCVRDHELGLDRGAPPPDESPGRKPLATILLHLNTPDEGGHTRFPDEGLVIQARRGRALVLMADAEPANARPANSAPRRPHAEPILRGERWVAVWQVGGPAPSR